MSQQTLRIARPTKIELIRLKKRVKVARRLHKVLKDRLIILTQELIMLVRDAVKLREDVNERIVECSEYLMKALPLSSPSDVETYLRIRYEGVNVAVGTRVVAGVRVPLIEVERVPGVEEAPAFPTQLTNAGGCFDDLTDLVARLGEVEESIVRLGTEVARVRRRVNALENVLIPRMENTIKYLEMKFEEREREDKTRMKKVKQILAGREGSLTAGG